MIQIWERDGELREEGKQKEGKEEERLKKNQFSLGLVFFPCLLDLEVCVDYFT